jgi:predicted RNase H-like HicB family nuclease
METGSLESIPIVLGQEDDGRWWADIESMPGVMAYGPTRDAAVLAVRSLALRVAADCIDHGEDVPPQFERVFSSPESSNYTFAFHDSEEIGPGLSRSDCQEDRFTP